MLLFNELLTLFVASVTNHCIGQSAAKTQEIDYILNMIPRLLYIYFRMLLVSFLCKSGDSYG